MKKNKVLYGAVMAATTSLWASGATAEFMSESLTLDDSGQFYCADAKDWCFGLASVQEGTEGEQSPVLVVVHEGHEVARQKIDHSDADDKELFGWQKTAIWPAWIRDPRLDTAFLIGITRTTSVGYSDGGASVSMLSLIRVENDVLESPSKHSAGFDVVATMPIQSSKMIRACFSEQDIIDRQEQCHDTYDFDADITPIETVGSEALPPLRYQAVAVKFPPWADLTKDSTTMPPLKEEDMVAAPDPECSFDKVFGFEGDAGVYRIDIPVEACSTYWVP